MKALNFVYEADTDEERKRMAEWWIFKISKLILQVKQEERERILKALSEERTDERIKKLFKEYGIKSVKAQNNTWNRAEGFNDYLKQIKDIIK